LFEDRRLSESISKVFHRIKISPRDFVFGISLLGIEDNHDLICGKPCQIAVGQFFNPKIAGSLPEEFRGNTSSTVLHQKK